MRKVWVDQESIQNCLIAIDGTETARIMALVSIVYVDLLCVVSEPYSDTNTNAG